jgi:hypothetical protein
MLPAIARNMWLKEKEQSGPVFDYNEDSLLRGKLKLMAILWVWQYRLIFWVRGGWHRRFLLKHPYLMERIGHFLYYFPSTIPGFMSVLNLRKSVAKLLRRGVQK